MRKKAYVCHECVSWWTEDDIHNLECPVCRRNVREANFSQISGMMESQLNAYAGLIETKEERAIAYAELKTQLYYIEQSL